MTSSTFVAGDGEGYEMQMGRWSRRLAPPFIAFAGITSGANVLDVGSGTGNLSLALAENPAIGRIQGIDYVSAYVDYARSRNRDPRVDFQVGDATAVPFADATFDHALSMLVLQFVPQSDVAVREMRRVTRPGGTVTAATWDTRGGLVTYRIFFDTAAMIDSDAGERRARSFTRPLSGPGGLARAWRAAGFEKIVEDTVTIRMDFASFVDFWSPCEGRDGPIADYVRTLDEAKKAAIKEAVRNAYLDGESDGPRSYAATSWVVKGTVPA